MVKDWAPPIIYIPRGKDFRFTPTDHIWTNTRREWLHKYYPVSENWALAAKINTTERDIINMARSMRLTKSHEFTVWENKVPGTREKGCPLGFHFETDEELAQRREKERQQDEKTAKILAKNYEFCDAEEKAQIAKTLMEAMRWGRETQPKNEYGFEYWN